MAGFKVLTCPQAAEEVCLVYSARVSVLLLLCWFGVSGPVRDFVQKYRRSEERGGGVEHRRGGGFLE